MSTAIQIPLSVVVKAALSALHAKKYDQVISLLEIIEEAVEPNEVEKRPRKRRSDAKVETPQVEL